LSRNTEALCNSLTILRVNFVEKLNHLFLDVSPGTSETTANVLNKVSSVSFIHDFSEESSGLLVIIIRMLVRVSASKTSNGELSLLLAWVLNWAIKSVWLIVRCTSLVAIDGGGAISLIVSNSSSIRAVDRNLFIVGTESVSVGVRVGEESSLEHLISRRLNAWDNMGRSKCRLLNFSEIVLWVFVEYNFAYRNQGVVFVWNDLCDIENIILVVLSLLFGNELNIPCP